MTTHAFLFAGLFVGFSIAAPIGPMGLLCIQRTLVCGMRAGVSTGLGAATINVAYGALIILGLDKAASYVVSGGRVLSCAGGVILLCWAGRTMWHQDPSQDRINPVKLSPYVAYGSALAFNVANPLLPILLVGVLSPIIGQSAPSLGGAVALLLGMFTAATAWWICFSGCVALLRSRLSSEILVLVNRVASALLTFYGIAALARSTGM
jgi:threonine/homoserine/homoserine lactone efflux protein